MKYCILTPRFPFPENGGDVLLINNIAKYLKSKSIEVVLISFYDGELELKKEYFDLYDTIYMVKRSKILSYINSMLALLIGKPMQVGYYFAPKFLHKVVKVAGKELPDNFVAHLLRTTSYLELTHNSDKSIVQMTDALSKTYLLSTKTKGLSLKKIVYAVEKRFMKNYERHIIKKFPKVCLVSQIDIDYLKNNNTDLDCKNLAFYTNGVECLNALPDSTLINQNKICFIGNMRTLQNQDAVMFFVTEIFPIIKKTCPDAIFTIIGAEPPESILNLADGKNIVVTGFVDNIQDAIADSCIAVAPVRIAAGIQNKVLVAMGCGIPVVMTSLISQAIPELNAGNNCYICDSAQDIADNCIELLQNQNKRNEIGTKGWQMVQEKYSWTERLEGYENI